MYSSSLNRHINGAGTYVIRVFSGNTVYIIRLFDLTNCEEDNKEYDAVDYLLIFKKGIKTNREKGIEGAEGYYFKSKDAAAVLYNRLINKNSSLPKSAISFQCALEKIEDIIVQCFLIM